MAGYYWLPATSPSYTGAQVALQTCAAGYQLVGYNITSPCTCTACQNLRMGSTGWRWRPTALPAYLHPRASALPDSTTWALPRLLPEQNRPGEWQLLYCQHQLLCQMRHSPVLRLLMRHRAVYFKFPMHRDIRLDLRELHQRQLHADLQQQGGIFWELPSGELSHGLCCRILHCWLWHSLYLLCPVHQHCSQLQVLPELFLPGTGSSWQDVYLAWIQTGSIRCKGIFSMWSEDVHVFLVQWLSYALSGFGGAGLLQFSALLPSADNFILVGASAVIAALLRGSSPTPRLPKPCKLAPPMWLGLCNSTFSLLMSLLLVLNLLAQLCPPSGKELSLSSQTICSCACRGSPRPAGAGCAGCQNRRGHPLLFLLVPALRPSVRHGAAGYGPVGGPIHTLS